MANDGSPTQLRPCPATPNCVSSQAPPGVQYVEPLDHTDPSDLPTLQNLLSSMSGCTIVEATDRYLHAEFRSRVFGFIDDLELLIDTRELVIHVRSSSRIGLYDLGANRRRVEELRSLFSTVRSQPPV